MKTWWSASWPTSWPPLPLARARPMAISVNALETGSVAPLPRASLTPVSFDALQAQLVSLPLHPACTLRTSPPILTASAVRCVPLLGSPLLTLRLMLHTFQQCKHTQACPTLPGTQIARAVHASTVTCLCSLSRSRVPPAPVPAWRLSCITCCRLLCSRQSRARLCDITRWPIRRRLPWAQCLPSRRRHAPGPLRPWRPGPGWQPCPP